MAYQAIFKRYELKYLLTKEQKEKILKAIKPYMSLDEYGHTTIRNIYFDTDNYRLIRNSIEKPAYKEKLRIRSYEKATSSSKVFIELKKKYDHVVYKRRVCMPELEAMNWVSNKKHCTMDTQITEEIDYFLRFYENLEPKVFLSYEREAFYSKDASDFRITFDENILSRQNDLSLESDVYGKNILPDENVLMEIKCSGGIPLWMTHILSSEKLFKTSYSKYGTAYKTMIYPALNAPIVKDYKENIKINYTNQLAFQA